MVDPSPYPFHEPDETKITLLQAKKFNNASNGLAELAVEWSDRISKADGDEKIRLTSAYEEAKDRIVRKFGLAGLEEYDWMRTKAVADTTNRTVFQQAGVYLP
jgi:hypothetical protein